MRRINIASPEFEVDHDEPDGYRSGMARLGPLVGASITGISIYELKPGESICPYHYEYGEEEWVLVLEGRPLLRHPEGADSLEPWDLVFFPTGPEGAHKVTNDTGETARVMMFSNVNTPGATVYPDSDKIGIWPGNKADSLLVRRESGVDYWDGEKG